MSRKMNKPAATPATKALEDLGIAYEARPYEHDPRAMAYGTEAADKLGLPSERVFKTLVVQLDHDGFALACVPVSGEVDLKAVAAALGAKKASLASPADAQRLTGYVLGGVSPLGSRTALPSIVDASAQQHARVYVSGGRRGFDVGLAPQDLLRATGARSAPVAR